MKNKMRKIYNEITIGWNEKTQRYDEVLHEDSFMYDGPVMEMEKYFDVHQPTNSFNVYSDYGCNGFWAGTNSFFPQIATFTQNLPTHPEYTEPPNGVEYSWQINADSQLHAGILPGFGEDPWDEGGGIGTRSMWDGGLWEMGAWSGYVVNEIEAEPFNNYYGMVSDDYLQGGPGGDDDIGENNCASIPGSIDSDDYMEWGLYMTWGQDTYLPNGFPPPPVWFDQLYKYAFRCEKFGDGYSNGAWANMTRNQKQSIPSNVWDFMNMLPDTTLICQWSMANRAYLGEYEDDVQVYGHAYYGHSGHIIMVRRVPGCTDQFALNYGYNQQGVWIGTPNVDDGSCEYATYSLYHSVEYFGYPDSPNTEPQDLSFVNKQDVDIGDWGCEDDDVENTCCCGTTPLCCEIITQFYVCQSDCGGNPTVDEAYCSSTDVCSGVCGGDNGIPVCGGGEFLNYEQRGWMTYYHDEDNPGGAKEEEYNEFKTGLSWTNWSGDTNTGTATSVSQTGDLPHYYSGGDPYPYPQAIAGTEDQILEIVVRHPNDYIYTFDEQPTDSNIWAATHNAKHTGLGASTHPSSMEHQYTNADGFTGLGAGLGEGDKKSVLGLVTPVYTNNELKSTSWRASIKCYFPSLWHMEHQSGTYPGEYNTNDCHNPTHMGSHSDGSDAICDNFPPIVDVVLYGGKFIGHEGDQGEIIKLNSVRYYITQTDQWSDDLAINLVIGADDDIDHLGFALEFPPPWGPATPSEASVLTPIDGQGNERCRRDGSRFYFDRLNVQSLAYDIWPGTSDLGGSGNPAVSNETIALSASGTIDPDDPDGITPCDYSDGVWTDPTNGDSEILTGCHQFEWLYTGCVNQTYQNWNDGIGGNYASDDNESCGQVVAKLAEDLNISEEQLYTGETVISREDHLTYTAPDLLFTRQPIVNFAIKVIDYEDLMDYDLIKLHYMGSNHSPNWVNPVAMEMQVQNDIPGADGITYEVCNADMVGEIDAECLWSISEDSGLDSDGNDTDAPGILDLRPHLVDMDYPELLDGYEWWKWAMTANSAKININTGEFADPTESFWIIDQSWSDSDYNAHPITITEGPGSDNNQADYGVAHLTWGDNLMYNCANITNAKGEFGTCTYNYKIKFWAQDPGGSAITGVVKVSITSADNPRTWNPIPGDLNYWGDGYVATGEQKEFFFKPDTISGAIQDIGLRLYANDYESCPVASYAQPTDPDEWKVCFSCTGFGGGDTDDPGQCLFYETAEGTQDTFTLNPASGNGIIKWGTNSSDGSFSGCWDSNCLYEYTYLPAVEVTYDDALASVSPAWQSTGNYCPDTTLSIKVVDDANNPLLASVNMTGLCPPTWGVPDWGLIYNIDETETRTDIITFYTKPNGAYETVDGWLTENIAIGLRSDYYGDLFVDGESGYQIPITIGGMPGEDTGEHVTITAPLPLHAATSDYLQKFDINISAPRVDDFIEGQSETYPFHVVLCNKQLMMDSGNGTPEWSYYCSGTTNDGDSCTEFFTSTLYCPIECVNQNNQLTNQIDEDACVHQYVSLTLNGTTTVNDPLIDDDIIDFPTYDSWIYTNDLQMGQRNAEEICVCLGDITNGGAALGEVPCTNWENDNRCNDGGVFIGKRGYAFEADENTTVTSISFQIETGNDGDFIYFGTTGNTNETDPNTGLGGVVLPVDIDEGTNNALPTYGMYEVPCEWASELGDFGDRWNCGIDFGLDLTQGANIVSELNLFPNDLWENERWITFRIFDNYWDCVGAECGEDSAGNAMGPEHHQLEIPVVIRVYDTNDPPIAYPVIPGNSDENPIVMYEDEGEIAITLKCTDNDGDRVRFWIGDTVAGPPTGMPQIGTLQSYSGDVGNDLIDVVQENQELHDDGGTPSEQYDSLPPDGVTTTVYYTPNPDAFGLDSFMWYCKDTPFNTSWPEHFSNVYESPGIHAVTTYIRILPINDPPVIVLTTNISRQR